MGLWENARKFIKRKDSDAGETGKALEELRGSIYNDIRTSESRTSESARRLQQRFCGPVVAMSFNFLVAVGVILTNKMVMKKVGFNFPILLTLIHYAVAWVSMAVLKALSWLPVSPPSKSTPSSSVFTLGVVMAFATGLANTSLNHNSVGFYQMAKIAVTPSIVLTEFIFFSKTICYNKVLALALVSVGVAVATVTDLEFNLFGACVAVAWIIPSAVNKILWSNMQQQSNWTAMALMWKTTPVTIFFLLALMPWLDPPGVLSFSWDLISSSAILTSAALGFLLQWSGALALGLRRALSFLEAISSLTRTLGFSASSGQSPRWVGCSSTLVLASRSPARLQQRCHQVNRWLLRDPNLTLKTISKTQTGLEFPTCND